MVDNDTCDYCGTYVDPIGGDNAIAKEIDGEWLLFCCIDHYLEYRDSRGSLV
jgi:hypothetical protein